MSLPLVQYVLLAAVRDKFLIALTVLFLVASSLSIFLGSAAALEQDYFSLIFTGGTLRFTGVVGLVLFCVFFIRRSFEAQNIEFLLSSPVTRVQLVLSYSFALSMLALFMTLLQGIALYAVSPHLFGEGHLYWIASILVENIVMVNVALFFAMVLNSSISSAMVCFAFYVLGRMMGQVLGVVDSGVQSNKFLEFIMQVISSVMPRFDLMGQTSWLIYGPDAQVGYGFIAVQGVVFTMLVLCACLIDLVRRQF
jgi:ABC-type transport system involved in multi-copper enzyme maturation permease subunit